MKGLLSVSFGTSHADTRAKTIDAVDADVRACFPDRAFYTAWTSPRIIAKVREERGEHHDTLEEAFERLASDGVDDLVVSTMCLMQGHEMNKVARAVGVWAAEGDRVVRLAEPLLTSAEDRVAVAHAVADEFSWLDSDDVLLLMGHGSPQGANELYFQIQEAFREIGQNRIIVATVEGALSLDDVMPTVESLQPAKVHLAPLMVVAGDHAKNDLAGSDEDSWKSKLEARGMDVQAHLKGLGEYAGIRQLVCDHARAAQPYVSEGAQARA